MTATKLTDVAEDALLLIIQRLILDSSSVNALRKSCKYFYNFFRVYRTEVTVMKTRALEAAWMTLGPLPSSSVRLPTNTTEKEQMMNQGEEAHNGGVIFLAACDKYVVLVRYNEQDGVVCACPNLECGCSGEDDPTYAPLQLFSRKRLEIWSLDFNLIRVISSEQFGRSFSAGSQGPAGNWPRYQFWSGARVRSPMFTYDRGHSVFVWLESQAREVEVNLHDVDKDVTEIVRIHSNADKEVFPRAVSMHRGVLAILYEKDEQNLLFLRVYQHDTFLMELRISELEPDLMTYTNFVLDHNKRFIIVAYSIWIRGMPSAISTQLTSVKADPRLTLPRNISETNCDRDKTVGEGTVSRNLPLLQAYLDSVKISPISDLVAVTDSDDAGRPIVKLLRAEDLEEVMKVQVTDTALPLTPEPYRGGILWRGNVLLVFTDELVEHLDEYAGRHVTRFLVRLQRVGGEVSCSRQSLDFWPGLHRAQARVQQSLGSWRQERHCLHLEASAASSTGLLVAFRGRKGDSALAYLNMITSS